MRCLFKEEKGIVWDDIRADQICGRNWLKVTVRDGKPFVNQIFHVRQRRLTSLNSGEFQFGEDLDCFPSCTLDLLVENMGRWLLVDSDKNFKPLIYAILLQIQDLSFFWKAFGKKKVFLRGKNCTNSFFGPEMPYYIDCKGELWEAIHLWWPEERPLGRRCSPGWPGAGDHHIIIMVIHHMYV